ADISATLRGLADFSPKPWPVRLRELQARGGRIEIGRARVQQGNAIAVSAGTLGLTARGRRDGLIECTIIGLQSRVRTHRIDGVARSRETSRGAEARHPRARTDRWPECASGKPRGSARDGAAGDSGGQARERIGGSVPRGAGAAGAVSGRGHAATVLKHGTIA